MVDEVLAYVRDNKEDAEIIEIIQKIATLEDEWLAYEAESTDFSHDKFTEFCRNNLDQSELKHQLTNDLLSLDPDDLDDLFDKLEGIIGISIKRPLCDRRSKLYEEHPFLLNPVTTLIISSGEVLLIFISILVFLPWVFPKLSFLHTEVAFFSYAVIFLTFFTLFRCRAAALSKLKKDIEVLNSSYPRKYIK